MSRTRLFAASALLSLIAFTSAAHAGPTISDKRYWPNEAHATNAYHAERHMYRAEQTGWRQARAMKIKAAPETRQQAPEARRQECNYQGGPKFSACSQ